MIDDKPKTIWIERVYIQGNPYLTRVHLTPWDWWPSHWRRLYLHIFQRPDEDRVFHDHPFHFDTLVLWGGYDETSHELQPIGLARYKAERGQGLEPTGKIIHDRLGWLAWRSRPSTHAHRITRLHTRRVVTLIFRTEKVRDWGFWCPPNLPEYAGMTRSTVNNQTDKWLWVGWRDYLDEPEPLDLTT